MRAILSTIALLLVLFVALAGVFGQNPQADSKPPAVEWSDLGNGWVKVNQLNDGMSLAVKKNTISVIAYHGPDSPYARTVYRDLAPLVVFNVIATEYRVRCPDEKTAGELIKFLLGTDDNGER